MYGFGENLPTMMRAADCVLCKAGGLIVTEALACGLPLLLVDVLPGQETGNAAHVVASGTGQRCDGAIEALETLCHWLDRGGALLAERTRNARRLGRPRAAYDVAELAWTAAGWDPASRTKPPVIDLAKLRQLLGAVERAGGGT